MSVVRYGVAVQILRVRCMITRKNIISGEMVSDRSVKDTKMIKSLFLVSIWNNTGTVENGNQLSREQDRECRQRLLRNNSLSAWPSFLKTFIKSCRSKRASRYLVFTFGPFHNLHLGISRLVKECAV